MICSVLSLPPARAAAALISYRPPQPPPLHLSRSYFVMVAAEDEDKLSGHTELLLKQACGMCLSLLCNEP